MPLWRCVTLPLIYPLGLIPGLDEILLIYLTCLPKSLILLPIF